MTTVERERHLGRCWRLLMRAGLSEDLADRLAPALEVEPGADDAAIEACIADWRDTVPGLFPAAAPGAPSGGSTGSTTEAGEFGATGAAEAARRFGDRTQGRMPPSAADGRAIVAEAQRRGEPLWVSTLRVKHGDEAADRALERTRKL